MAITRIIETASARELSLKPGPTTYFTSGSAKMIIKIEVAKVNIASRFKILVLSSQADFLLFLAIRWLKTGMKVTLNAPETKIKNIKSGIIKATE